MDNHLPLILVEGVLTFGGVLAFAWWQFRDLRREREKAARAAAASPGRVGEDGESAAGHSGKDAGGDLS